MSHPAPGPNGQPPQPPPGGYRPPPAPPGYFPQGLPPHGGNEKRTVFLVLGGFVALVLVLSGVALVVTGALDADEEPSAEAAAGSPTASLEVEPTTPEESTEETPRRPNRPRPPPMRRSPTSAR